MTNDDINKKKDTNASPSAFGWVFQVGAGITLMLSNIKEFSSMKMEGKSDDIEISLDDGKIYAQAKSVTQMGNQSTASANLNAALDLLVSDNKNGDAIKLIYITNILNPLSSEIKSGFEYENVYDFSSLSVEDQNKIKSKVGEDFPTEKLQIHIMRFFGEGDNKFAKVKEKIEEFLREAIDDKSYSKRLLDSWFETFMVNCSDKPNDKKELSLSKSEIIMPIILLVIESPLDENEFNKVCDYDEYSELLQEYRMVIDRRICDYSFVSRVAGDFLQKRELVSNKTNFKYEYVNKEWQLYESDFASISDVAKREALIKLILLTIISRRTKISKIKEAANL